MLKDAYNVILANRSAWNIQRLFWYHWRDPKARTPSCSFCQTAGLVKFSRSPKPALPVLQELHQRHHAADREHHLGAGPGLDDHQRHADLQVHVEREGLDLRVQGGRERVQDLRLAVQDVASGQREHSFSVRATDAAGNVSGIVSRAFTVNAS